MNADPHSSHPVKAKTDVETVIDLQVRRYRMAQRRRTSERIAQQSQRHLSGEAAEIIRFALIWAPYGGVPADEALQRFGMSTRRFIERLWQAAEEAGCDLQITNQFARIYPRHNSR